MSQNVECRRHLPKISKCKCRTCVRKIECRRNFGTDFLSVKNMFKCRKIFVWEIFSKSKCRKM